VTELVTGLDLVELQLLVAMGEELPLAQEDVRIDGHAVEVRLYAEAPEDGFLPQAGRVEHVRWPPGVRVDAGIEEGTDVPPHYDPLVAKVAAHGSGRDEALASLREALARTELLGPRTNIAFLRAITDDGTVKDGRVTTDWLESTYAGWRPPPAGPEAVALAAAAEADRILRGRRGRDPWVTLGPWRAGAAGSVGVTVRSGADEVRVAVEGAGPYRVGRLELHRLDDCHGWRVDGARAAAAPVGDAWLVWHGGQHELAVGIAPRRIAAGGPARLDSPLPGQVIAVRAEAGERVEAGEELVVVEAMKMEHAVRAPAPGTVRAVLCAPGDAVERGQPLVDFEPD
jgi:3-methylcrotonyl-CoA carboxylase alpha subunit